MAEPGIADKSESSQAEEHEKPADSNPPADNGSSSRTKLPLLIAFVLCVVWWIVLASMAAFTANPPTLNYEQFSLENAEVVVVGNVKDRDKGTFDVKESHFSNLPAGEITITNLKNSSVKSEGDFLIPLRGTPSGAWEVVPTPLPKNNLIAYPVSEHTRAQFEAIKTWRAKSTLPPP